MIEPTMQYEIDPTSYDLHTPLSPQSPRTPPMSPPSPYQDSYRRTNNPLVDLAETEKKYVEDLKCLLKQVTACWSEDNLPSSKLDLMFRHIEVIYRQNKKFYSKLTKIGSNPESAKDLGDTLMVWIDDMEGPYTKYAENFKLGFDSQSEIEENLNLQQILNNISAEKNQPVSLDYFFDMPLKRLHYYKKLYMRLYRATEPGRSDHSILLAANERIDRLLEIEKEIKNTNKMKEEVVSSMTISPVTEEVVSSAVVSPDVDYVSSMISSPTIEIHLVNDEQDNIVIKPPSIKSSTICSPVNSNINVSTDEIKKNWTLEELEKQLDTSKTKDLFTKLPKVVKVSLIPTNLLLEREIVLHDDFIIETTKSMNSTEIYHIDVHIFLLSDLLLICQKITQEEKQEFSLEKDLRLLFPPLNVNHLTVEDASDDKEDILELTILRKEMLVLYAGNTDIKDNWLREITKAIELSPNAIVKPQLYTDSVQTIRKAASNPRLSMPITSADALRRSPSVGNLINKGQVKPLRPMSSISQSSRIFPDFDSTDVKPIVRERTPDSPQSKRQSSRTFPDFDSKGLPDLPQKVGGNDSLPSELGERQVTYLDVGNKSAERSNSMTSLVSVMSIATFKETIFRSSACEVFVWRNKEWKSLTKKDNCIVEVRLTVQNKGCWAILLESSNRMVLNAWVHLTTTLFREDVNSVSISCDMGQRKEYYKITTVDSAESDQFLNNLLKIKESARESNVPTDGFISRSSSLQIEPLREVEQTVTQVMEAKCRVFLQNDHGVWTNIGWGNMKLSLESPSHRKRIIVNSDKKTKTIIDAIIWEDGVERIGKSVALTLNNMGSNLRIVYLFKMKDEASAVQVIDIMKEKRKK